MYEGQGCPYCANRAVDKNNCLAKTDPKLAKEWHPTKNLALKVSPQTVLRSSHKKAWWQCKEEKTHVWCAQIYSRIAGNGCPHCSGKIASDRNRLSVLFPEIAAQWHKTMNGNLTPYDIAAGSNKRVWWQCEKSIHHVWEIDPSHRTLEGTGCPFCVGRKITIDNNLHFLYPQVAQYWNKKRNGSLQSREVAPMCMRKVWWICSWGHEFQAVIGKMVRSHLEYGTNGCMQCAIEARSKANSKSLKSRFRSDKRAAHRDYLKREEDERNRLIDPTVL